MTDVGDYGNFTYVATSEGHVYLLESYKPKKRVRVAKPWREENLRAFVKIGIGEKYVAVIYSFVRPSGDERRGLCVYTKNLIKLACKRLSYTPKDVNVIGNTVYIREFHTKRVRAYTVDALCSESTILQKLQLVNFLNPLLYLPLDS
ncbi:hypothetical protein VFC49_01150 [Thermococcus sp. SY098]|uniref:hypothetical protein n=1 Tax=Thermococcus sp. SY098 TaxID=3111325 RepID=UPI002D79CDEC|nr:hypothetical protein [Thermococcus sp. SY098]WRS52802.1 hypothetical protein VFC49_01150 [Thermococcus sp. SY098]